MSIKPRLMQASVSGFKAEDGTPLSDGLLYVYKPGTTEDATVWKNYFRTLPHDQPIQLDGRGCETIFGAGLYKLVVKTSADAMVKTMDNVFIGNIEALPGALYYTATISPSPPDGTFGKHFDMVFTSNTFTGEKVFTGSIGGQAIRFAYGVDITSGYYTMTVRNAPAGWKVSAQTANPVYVPPGLLPPTQATLDFSYEAP